jgi:hypothetical protein
MAGVVRTSWLVTIAALAVGLAAGARADPAPAPAPAPAAAGGLARLLGRADALAREVAQRRGLRLARRIPREVASRDELRRRLVSAAAAPAVRAEAAAERLALARWGLIPIALDYEAAVLEILTEQIAGYYDPETGMLTLAEGSADDPQWAELVLAHEIVHALQDQAFGLERFDAVPDGEDDARAARRALVEGDGVALMLELMLARSGERLAWSDRHLVAAIEAAMLAPGTEAIDRAPLAIREAMIFPYRAGLAFVAALRRRKSWRAVDAAFRRPPRSTEQILHPERYLADDRPVPLELEPPPALRGYTRVHRTVWGELGFQVLLRSHGVPESRAAIAAAGWGGDRAIVLARDGDPRPERAAAISRSEWDSEADALEAAEAVTHALAAAVVGGVVEQSPTRTQWLAIDGTAAWVERRGPSLVIAIGVPAWAAAAVAREAWSGARVLPAAPTSAPTRARRSRAPGAAPR